jgi:hypothetical protein
MSTPPGVLTAVRWSELFPWLLLVRAARAALFVRMIVLGAVGVWATQAGWSAIETAFLRDDDQPRLERLTDDAAFPVALVSPLPLVAPPVDAIDWRVWSSPLVRGWRWALQPLARLVEAPHWRSGAALVLAGVWTLAVWALIGGAMARISALYLARGELLGPIAALRSAAANWLATIAAPSFCVGVIAVFVVLLLLAGLVMRLGFLAFLAGLLWPVTIVIGLAIAVFAIGLTFGWPFMWSTIAAERTDAFDGISRGYAFVYQRPLHLLFFVIVAAVLGALAQAAVNLIVFGAHDATLAAVERGMGDEALAVIHRVTPPEGEKPSVIATAGGKMVRFWSMALLSLATAFPMTYLWPAAMGIYLLQRRLIDSTELGEVALEEGPSEEGLPPLVRNPATGVPNVQPAAPQPAPPGEPSTTVTDLRGGST